MFGPAWFLFAIAFLAGAAVTWLMLLSPFRRSGHLRAPCTPAPGVVVFA